MASKRKRASIDAALERKSKDELLALTQEMLKRDPELEGLIAPSKSKGKRRAPVDPQAYRRQIRLAMGEADEWGWGAEYGIAREIASVVDAGDKFAKQGDWENAQAVYQAVIDEALPDYELTHDEGEIAAEIDRAVQGLGDCLAARAPDPIARRGLLRALFNVVKWDIEAGGLGIGEDSLDTLLKHATAEDRLEIRKWIESAIKATGGLEGFSRKWRREQWGQMLLSLAESDDDVEGFLKRAKAQKLYRPLFEKLVQLKRFGEAVEIANKHLTSSAWERLQAADKLEAAKRPAEALALVEAGLPGNDDDRLFEWLSHRYEKRGERARALDMQVARWKVLPTEETYEEIERIARPLKKWRSLRPRLLADLEHDRHFELLAHLLLRVKDWDAAWAAAEKETEWWSGIRLEVAEASETHRPERAIAVYFETAEDLIDRQGRENYKSAARYLRRARDLYGTIGKKDEWAQRIAALREQHRNKRLLLEQLKRAKL